MKPLDFNVLDNLAENHELQDLARQSLDAIKTMQVPVPQVGIPSHVVLPMFQKQAEQQFVLAFDNEQKGPYTISQLKDLLKMNIITEEFYIWGEGMSDWKKIKDCPLVHLNM